MNQQNIDLKEQIERCERLAQSMTDEEMRRALENLATDYKAQLKRQDRQPFMLHGEEAIGGSSGGSAAGAR